jgi:predicted nucleic acid-binding protein
MRYVIDASVSARWFLPTPDSARAIRLRADCQNRIHELHAPETILWETCNALIKVERQRIVMPGQAALFYLDFLSTQPILSGASLLVQRAMTIALRTCAGLYDCRYVVLALREQCPLVTADQRLVNNLQPQFPFVIPLSALP